jgi:hypothetical protein
MWGNILTHIGVHHTVCIFWQGFSWPAIVRASCLSGYISKMLFVRLSALFVVSIVNHSSTSERTVVLWLQWG